MDIGDPEQILWLTIPNLRTSVTTSHKSVQTQKQSGIEIQVTAHFRPYFIEVITNAVNSNTSIEKCVPDALATERCLEISFNHPTTPLHRTDTNFGMSSALAHYHLTLSQKERASCNSLAQASTAQSVLDYLSEITYKGVDLMGIKRKIDAQQLWLREHIDSINSSDEQLLNSPDDSRLWVEDLQGLSTIQKSPTAYWLLLPHDTGPSRYTLVAATGHECDHDKLWTLSELEQIMSYQVIEVQQRINESLDMCTFQGNERAGILHYDNAQT